MNKFSKLFPILAVVLCIATPASKPAHATSVETILAVLTGATFLNCVVKSGSCCLKHSKENWNPRYGYQKYWCCINCCCQPCARCCCHDAWKESLKPENNRMPTQLKMTVDPEVDEKLKFEQKAPRRAGQEADLLLLEEGGLPPSRQSSKGKEEDTEEIK